jgi:hypothetical protein
MEAVILKTVAKVGVARRPLCPQKWNISPLRCLNPLRFLVFDSETADEPEKSHIPLMKTALRLLGGTANSQLKQVAGFAKQMGKMSFPLPKNRYPAACYYNNVVL